ncbi:MAG: DNA repair protein RadA [Clostridia bacterium]|nr:DNA repair protein RadA [Clostridia bacterium]
MKSEVVFVCEACGAQASRWRGRCPDCGAWMSYAERPAPAKRARAAVGAHRARDAAAPIPLAQVGAAEGGRRPSGLGELDRALGGGFVPGSATLLGGEPGVGKSTLLLQVAEAVARREGPVLYVTGEESAGQVRLRAERLGLTGDGIHVLATSDALAVADAWERLDPKLVVVDSVQSLVDLELGSAAGGVAQVRQVAQTLIAVAKARGTPLVLVGHINKEGAIAGPKVLEHAVDTVLYVEGDRRSAYRWVRAAKNRFGPANEIGCFEMRETGLAEVANPSAWLLAERSEGSGSAVAACVEGTRPLLVEVEALVAETRLGTARRTALGADPNRMALLLAVLERRLGLSMGDRDAFLKVAGGVELDEPAADVPIALALVSSYLDRPLPADAAAFGEVGLGGEVRGVLHAEARVREAARLGFRQVVVPAANAGALARAGLGSGRAAEGEVSLVAVRRLGDAVKALLS